MAERNFDENLLHDIAQTRVRFVYPPALRSVFTLDVDGDFSFNSVIVPKQLLLPAEEINRTNRALFEGDVAGRNRTLMVLVGAVMAKLGVVKESSEEQIPVYGVYPDVPIEDFFKGRFWEVFSKPLVDSGRTDTLNLVIEIFMTEQRDFIKRTLTEDSRELFSLWSTDNFRRNLMEKNS